VRFEIRAGDIEYGGSASAHIKAQLTQMGIDAAVARRAGIISFEGEMNLIVYSDNGGIVEVLVEPETIMIEVQDEGPGIEDVELAMTPGYSTAPAWATDLGFGAGMGLINMRKNADRFEIDSQLGEGTRIRCWIDRPVDTGSGEQEAS